MVGLNYLCKEKMPINFPPQAAKTRVYHEELLSVPVYSSPDREQLVGSVDFPCPSPHYEWRQAGLALFLIT